MGVRLGLQQPVDELDFVDPDERGRSLQTDIRLEPAGQHIAVTVPPARHIGLTGQAEE
jgi:hypothetical protein